MKIEIIYTRNEQLWNMENIATEHGYKKTDDCYWVQIFRNENGDSIVTTREDSELNHDPAERLAAMLSPAESENRNEETRTMKIYLNHTTTDRSAKAAEAMSWHRAGDVVQVLTYDENGKELADVMIKGAAQKKESRLDENTERCKHIAEKLEEYVSGNVRRCPDCGETIHRDNWNYDLFKCQECGAVQDPDDWEQLSVWDFLGDDVYNVEFRVSGRGVDDLRSVQIMVACGGPNIYLDTASGNVELYWWGENAKWRMNMAAVDALNDWAEEYWGCL